MYNKKKITASEMGEVLFNFTVSNETYKNAMEHFCGINGIDCDRVRDELILLTVTIVELALRSHSVYKAHRDRVDEVLIRYLACFKEQTEQNNTGDEFIDLLEDRGKIYNKIIENDDPIATTHPPFNIAEAFAKFCGAENQPFFLFVAMQEFGSILSTVREFLDSYRLI
jgi:hypothetical protein